VSWQGSLGWLAGALLALGGGCGDDEPASVTADLRGTTTTDDDLVRLGATTTLVLRASEETVVQLRVAGVGNLGLEPNQVTIGTSPQTVVVTGERASEAEGDTRIEALVNGRVVASVGVTVVTGAALAFRGTFGFAVENNNGAVASGESCDGLDDPPLWRTTPLPCEGLNAMFNQVFVSEGDRPQRWSLASGKRPPIEVRVTGMRTYGPALDLAGRDPAIDVGATIGAMADAAMVMVTDDCDGDPNTGDPDGSEQGLEPLLDLGLRFGAALEVDAGSSPARLWTRFPTPPTIEETASDAADVSASFFPDGSTGCSDVISFLDENGAFQCNQAHSLADHLRRHAGFRSMVRRAWANYTNRQASVTPSGDSLVGELLGGPAELFLQLTDYDWYTLVGQVDKGVLASPGAIPARFEAWPVASCPDPREPDEEQDDHPFEALGM
jgi:hypothetical protein